MVANESYWRGPPRLREIIFRIVPDDNTVDTQLGVVDLSILSGRAAKLIRDAENRSAVSRHPRCH